MMHQEVPQPIFPQIHFSGKLNQLSEAIAKEWDTLFISWNENNNQQDGESMSKRDQSGDPKNSDTDRRSGTKAEINLPLV